MKKDRCGRSMSPSKSPERGLEILFKHFTLAGHKQTRVRRSSQVDADRERVVPQSVIES